MKCLKISVTFLKGKYILNKISTIDIAIFKIRNILSIFNSDFRINN